MKRIDFIEYDEDFADEVFPFLENEKLHILDKSKVEKYSDLILKNYPHKLGRVQFNLSNLILSKSDFVGYTEQDWTNSIKEKLTQIALNHKIKDLEFILIGDNEIENSYSFILENFLEYFWSFFSIPQHTYLISKNGKYLFGYTFEDDLYFAQSS
jgi:hypothetical protein